MNVINCILKYTTAALLNRNNINFFENCNNTRLSSYKLYYRGNDYNV